MKTVYVVRHAEAARKDKPIPDFERPLVKKGEKQAKDVARRLRRQGRGADILISSPAKRAIETGHIFARSLKYPVQKVLLRELLYESASTGDVVALLREQSNKHTSVMIFGHDPLFTSLTRTLTPEFTSSLPKGAVIAIAFDIPAWSDLLPGDGHVVYYDFPMTSSGRQQLEKREKKDLVGKLSRAFAPVLLEVMSDDPKRARKAAKKAAAAAVNDYTKKDQLPETAWRQLLTATGSETSSKPSDEPIKEEEVTS